MRRPSRNAVNLLACFAELPEPQQDTVAEFLIRRGLDVDRRGGMLAADYLLLIAGDLCGAHRQAFLDAVGRASLAAWEPEAANA